MSEHISHRISVLIRKLGYNYNSFSKTIGLTNNTTIGRIINEERNPSYDVINKIAVRFDNISTRWLLTGKGSTFTDSQLSEPPGKYSNIKLDSQLLKYLKEKDDELLKLSEENGKLKEKIKSLLREK